MTYRADTADEHVALRRVATLVAEGAPPAEIFAAVVDEASHVLEAATVMLARYDGDRAITVVASLSGASFEVGSRRPLDGPSVARAVLETGRPARVRDSETGSTVGVPIAVGGSVWGLMTVGARDGGPLPADTEERLSDFTELVAIAISNAESRERARRLADEQAALRRVATLVAEGVTTTRLCAAVVEEVVEVLDVPAASLVRYEPGCSMTVLAALNDPGSPIGSRWSLEGQSVTATVFETGRPARVDDFAGLPGAIAQRTRETGFLSALGVPIIVAGTVWGAVCVGTTEPAPLPAGTEARLADFTELVATSISKTESDDRLRRLADEQAALRRVATLVAESASQRELFSAVAAEVARILDVSSVSVVRYEPDGTSLVVASFDDPGFPVGSRWPVDEGSLNAMVFATALPARIDDLDGPGPVATAARASGMRSGAAAPISVDGTVWGMIAVGARHGRESLPPETETHLAAFTQLLATAISNAESRDGLRLLAHEQAALRRVATLVARVAPPGEIFSAVAEEVARVLGLPAIEIARYESDATATVIANHGGHLPVGSRWPLDGSSIMESVYRTGRPARLGDYAKLPGSIAAVARADGVQSAIGAPIVVEGAIWGAVIAISTLAEAIPEGVEIRLSLFTELVATAISNLQAHDDLRGLAGEQAALRRVATLVAEGGTAEELFAAVAREVAGVLGVSAALLDRYEADGTAVVYATSYDDDWLELAAVLHVGMRWPPDPGSLTATVHETGRAARLDDYSGLTGLVGETSRAAGIGSGCSAPIIVDGSLWGAIRVFSRAGTPLPGDTEARLEGFTELVATAVSNAAARADLIASRARIVAAGDEARRRIERNLHDGTQQRLIALGLDLQRIRALLADDQPEVEAGLERMVEDLRSVLDDVRELSRGLHPASLSRGGLRPSLRSLARRSPIPVEIDIELQERPPAAIETALYYVASEALTNAIKHSDASTISITIESDSAGAPFETGLDGGRGIANLHATIADDGVGGAEATEGSGLMGLADRIDALGGRFVLDSPPGGGTRISVKIPLGTAST